MKIKTPFSRFYFAFRPTITIFASMNDNEQDSEKWTQNVIIADADYIDKVAFDLTVNFERMIGRRIRHADMARWIECVALDGGVRGGGNEVNAILIHDGGSREMDNFAPADYEAELTGKAFTGTLGECIINSAATTDIAPKQKLLIDTVSLICSQKDVRRVMIVPDAEDAETMDLIRHALRNVDDDKRITVFTMQPVVGGNFRQEILGYSLMNALGIRADEIKD